LGVTKATADSWLYSAGLYIKGTGSGTKVMGLGLQSEYNGTAGADRIQGMASIVLLGGGGEAAKLLTAGTDPTAGLFAGWFKIGCNESCTLNSGSRAACIWLDSQLHGSGNLLGENYIMFVSTDNVTDAFIRFVGTGGHTNFISFNSDALAAGPGPVASGDIDGGTADKYLKVDLNGTAYGIQLYAI
jgi:hypothetical protein